MKRWIIFLLLLGASALRANEIGLVVLEQTGSVLVREGFKDQWEPCSPGTILKTDDTIWSKTGAAAKIKTGQARYFHLPPNSIIESKELISYSKAELVLILTSLEISKLPVKGSAPVSPSGAYVIHGEKTGTSESAVNAGTQIYLQNEVTGLAALVKQEYWAGCVLKIFKLQKFGSLPDQEFLQYQLVVAYRKLKLIRRFSQAKEQFRQKFPASKYLRVIEALQ